MDLFFNQTVLADTNKTSCNGALQNSEMVIKSHFQIFNILTPCQSTRTSPPQTQSLF